MDDNFSSQSEKYNLFAHHCRNSIMAINQTDLGIPQLEQLTSTEIIEEY